MRTIKVIQRKLSYGELLEKQRKAELAVEHSDTFTYSVKVADGWYKIFQKKKPQIN